MPALALMLSTAIAGRVGALDPDAETAIAAVEATGATLTGAQKDAANALIVTLKAASIWVKIDLLYLFLGGTAAAHAINWRNPGTNNVVWYNSPSHGVNGVQFGGTSYGDTGYPVSNAESAGLFAYVNTLNTVDTDFPLLAAQNDGLFLDAVLSFDAANLTQIMLGAQSARAVDVMPWRALGFVFGGRTDGVTLNQQVGGTDYNYTTSASGNSAPGQSLYIGACNYGGYAVQQGDGRLAAAGVAFSALDGYETGVLSTAMIVFQTALGRA